MTRDLTNFWQRFQSGIEVAVGGSLPEKRLGVRDGFVRYFHEGLKASVPISVTPQPQDESLTPLPVTDEDILSLAQSRARDLELLHGDRYGFYVGNEAGLLLFEAGNQSRYLVRSWTVVRVVGEEAWGSSGSVQLPESVIRGLDAGDLPLTVPGTRRSGGMFSSLTGGLETWRSTTALATVNAISTLMYGRLDSRPMRKHPRR